MYQSQNWSDNLLLGFTLIVHKQIEDLNNKNIDLKAKIYHLALGTIFKHL